MTKATAKATTTELKAATKKAAAKGLVPFKHVPDPRGTHAEKYFTDEGIDKIAADSGSGVDSPPVGAVQSGFSVFNQPSSTPETTLKENLMTKAKSPVTETPTQTEQDADAVKAKIDKMAEKLKAQIKQDADADAVKAKMAEKAAKLEAQTKAREQAALDKKAKADARATKANETKEQHDARIAELKASGKTYTGSMLALADRVKQGVYVKSATGQLRSTDALAVAMDEVPPENAVKLGMALFEEPNKYAALNIGQQSMNYRNRMRGAIKAGKLTLETIVETIKANSLAIDTKAEREAKAKAAEAKKAEAAKKQADKDAAAKAAAEKKAKELAKAAAEKKAKELAKAEPVTV
jgi:colicin import membrane protein